MQQPKVSCTSLAFDSPSRSLIHRCSEAYSGFAGSSSVSCTKDKCAECDANLLSVDLSKVQTKLSQLEPWASLIALANYLVLKNCTTRKGAGS